MSVLLKFLVENIKFLPKISKFPIKTHTFQNF